jgi:hypothetical protein
MDVELVEMEGTVAEIQAFLSSLGASRLHITVSPVPSTEAPHSEAAQSGRSISERLLAMAEEMPEEYRTQMPSDLAEQHDHYIYGWSRR